MILALRHILAVCRVSPAQKKGHTIAVLPSRALAHRSLPESSAVTTAPAVPEPTKLTLTHWLILTVASIGFLFDTYELLMLPLIAAPALSELLGVPPNNPLVREWVGIMLWPAARVRRRVRAAGRLADRPLRPQDHHGRRVSCCIRFRPCWRRSAPRPLTLSSSAARRSSACVSNSWPPSPGSRNCFPDKRNARAGDRLDAGVCLGRRTASSRGPTSWRLITRILARPADRRAASIRTPRGATRSSRA